MAHFDEFRKIGILRNQAFRSVPFRRIVDTFFLAPRLTILTRVLHNCYSLASQTAFPSSILKEEKAVWLARLYIIAGWIYIYIYIH